MLAASRGGLVPPPTGNPGSAPGWCSHPRTIGTMLNFNGDNNGHGLKDVTRKQIV